MALRPQTDPERQRLIDGTVIGHNQLCWQKSLFDQCLPTALAETEPHCKEANAIEIFK